MQTFRLTFLWLASLLGARLIKENAAEPGSRVSTFGDESS